MEKSAFSKKLVFIGVIVGVILIGLGVWYFLFYNKGASVQVNADDFTETSDTTTPDAPLPPNNGAEPPIDSEPVNEGDLSLPPDDTTTETLPDDGAPPQDDTVIEDADSDGLTDAEERSLGTNPASPDTDNDGLSDREEIRTYGTDPTNPDTDGDGFEDGSEVENGFDPNGSGRLLQIPQ